MPTCSTRRFSTWALMVAGGVFTLGCVTPQTRMDLLAAKIDRVSQEVNAVKAEVSLNAGGDINEPVTAWIMAAALGLVALSYPVGKLIWLAVSRRMGTRKRE